MKASEFLDRFVLSVDDTKKFRKTLEDIEAAAEKQAGSSLVGFFVEVHPERINSDIARAIQIALHKDGWTVEITLMPSKLNQRLPGAWRIACMPEAEILNATTVHTSDNQMTLC